MPSKNTIKTYVNDGYYHIYNRGVEKRTIFQDLKDYKTFLSYLKLYLTPPPKLQKLQGDSSQVIQNASKLPPSKQLKNYHDQIDLLAYCLMPNHFHIMVKQYDKTTINYFMRSLATKYVRYFNTRHNRIGGLFQSAYKAVLIDSEEQFLYLTKYIHRNPLSLSPYKDCPHRLKKYPYSSYQNYLKLINQTWVKPAKVLSYFSTTDPNHSYRSFVEQPLTSQENSQIKDLTLE